MRKFDRFVCFFGRPDIVNAAITVFGPRVDSTRIPVLIASRQAYIRDQKSRVFRHRKHKSNVFSEYQIIDNLANAALLIEVIKRNLTVLKAYQSSGRNIIQITNSKCQMPALHKCPFEERM